MVASYPFRRRGSSDSSSPKDADILTSSSKHSTSLNLDTSLLLLNLLLQDSTLLLFINNCQYRCPQAGPWDLNMLKDFQGCWFHLSWFLFLHKHFFADNKREKVLNREINISYTLYRVCRRICPQCWSSNCAIACHNLVQVCHH